MAAGSGRFIRLRWLQNIACTAAAVGALILILVGIISYADSGDASGIWLIAGGGFTMFLAVMLMSFAPLLLTLESTLSRLLNELKDINATITKQGASIEQVAENTRISESAKALAHRDQELDALRAAIRDDLRKEEWEAALYLVDEIERRFGCKQECDRIREEVDDARNTAIHKKLQEAIDMIESHFQSHEWERAQGEIDRLLTALPDSTQVLALQDRMLALKEQHKQELKLAWDEAVRRNDTDHAIEVLRLLDQYITGQEAKELRDSARNVFKDKLLQLGIQFRFAVNERRWSDALNTGLELIREFPNARMANEVREALDALRERARVAEKTPR